MQHKYILYYTLILLKYAIKHIKLDYLEGWLHGK